jgi:hypothetical protein
MGNLLLVFMMVLFVIYFTFILIPALLLSVTVVASYFRIQDYTRIYLYREKDDTLL